MKNRYSLKTLAKLENLEQVLAFIDKHLEDSICTLKTQMMMNVVTEELFVNITHYAYPGTIGEAEITIWLENDPKAIVIEFRDNGIPYDPLAKEDPDITLSADERPIGGLGIYMVKKCMDDIQYKRENDQNVLTIRKYF